ncbi:MAG: hypothetical protein K2X39_02845 [Silvanigrellaceae bacterium]|nr:hypothetical protein [Silvanigrellaceae bacterium]
MDIKTIKELAQKYSTEQLDTFALELEKKGTHSCSELQHKSDANALMSDFLQAMEVKNLMESGMSLNDALREFSKRVRGVLS